MRAPLPVAALLLIVACGGHESRDSQTERGRDYVDAAVEASYVSPENPDGPRCFYAGLVDNIGLDALNEAGVTAEKLADALWGDLLSFRLAADSFSGLEVSESQAREGADLYFGCFDVVEVYSPFFVTHTDNERACIRSAIEAGDSELRAVAREELLRRGNRNLIDGIAELGENQCHVSWYMD